ncbi:MAG: PqqD family peptide modification chaperone [Candidatus Nanoarchaeia archaeon]|nr:PqqD family peptide modification chaperone [Candidatus Nanoarchaeia archaeon]
MFKPIKRKGLVPAKNAEKIGVADKESEKFFELNEAYINVWLLCDGKKSEDEIAKEFCNLLIKNSAKSKKINSNKILLEAKEILKRLRKFNLIE